MPEDVRITNNREDQRFEAEVDGRRGALDYNLAGDKIVFTHIGVDPQLEGKGVAAQLTRHALDHARAEGLRVVPTCPYVRDYVRKHPEYHDLVQRWEP